jgi:hypothetical protein
MAEHSPLDIVRHASTWSIIWGILLIAFGVLAIGSPFLAAVAVSTVIAHNLEPFECFHVGTQGARPHSSIQGNSETERVSGDEILAVILTPTAAPAGPPLR